MRAPLEGTLNVLRFNWPGYVLAVTLLVSGSVFATLTEGVLSLVLICLAVLSAVAALSALTATYLIYDRSSLYHLPWLNELETTPPETILNINAGFDETSAAIAQRFDRATLWALDFYDPTKHTEGSIARARKAYPPYPGTRPVATGHLPFDPNSVNLIHAFLSLHEIRDAAERCGFFKEMHRILEPKGRVVVTEHLRDAPNFVAFTIGFMHFHSRASWLKTFHAAGFEIASEVKTTPFITTFTLVRA